MAWTLSSISDRLLGLLGYVRATTPVEQAKFDTRNSVFAVNELLYDNQVYELKKYGGALEDVLKVYFNRSGCDPAKYPIVGHFHPFKEIVDTYLQVLPGTWGRELKVAPTIKGRPVNPKLTAALDAVAESTNLDTEKQKLQRWAANFGTVGIRVVAQTPDGDEPARVFLQIEKPDRIFDFEEDSRGNVVAVVLKFQSLVNRGSRTDPEYETVEVVEELTAESFSQKIEDREQLSGQERRNPFGFCPFKILRHKDNGTAWGDWAYRGSERAVHAINFRISRQDVSIDRHQFPKWFGTAGGPMPTSIDMGDGDVLAYVQSEPGAPPPSLTPLVPQLDQVGSMEFWMQLRDLMRSAQPELTINDVKLLSGISGETLAQVLKPAAKKILDARPHYDHALIGALKMAVSMGSDLGIFDVGTGSGDGAGDNAFRSGQLDFQFEDRPALPLSVYDELKAVEAKYADPKARFEAAKMGEGVVSHDEQLRAVFYSEEDIARINGERATEDVIPTLEL